mmetsp:Transcript_12831/g.20962  ORF Transcript_12831/g.20962 Transcript_12831/m.20962 type:complete len:522 (-) Transcript_12831:252-1817(-)|eukprot:CAMPEP_0196132098 /NCGR_PEP_ID=MMETSP0910-20130528/1844_1 /TAXON_ID=49265 /ORGANISM="Thalassiosira rotula, Strain GSO102" /LENGTH=521 /DNA_ID=CAMNT_0041391653 /DNA_START=137 /DNA_END=1702 /DNA_ORIENTATION=+
MARGRTSRSGKKPSAKSRRVASSNNGKVAAKEDSRPMEERLQSIEYHWNGFGPLAKRFLLQEPSKLSLTKFLNFFSLPDQIVFAQMSVSVGTAHMLAYEYFNVGAYANAKALTLCGAFFQQVQCEDTPIEKMMTMSIKDENNPTELPLFYQGVKATKDDVSTSCYLKRVLPLKYQRIMGFESHTQNTPGQQYTDLIANDWNGTSNSSKVKRSKESSDETEIMIVLSNKDDATEHEKSIKMDTTLKSLFNAYADSCGVSLRSLRFAYNGNTLFLSSVGQKTPLDMGMKHMDTINVSNNKTSSNPEEQPKAQNKKKTTKSKKTCRGKQERKFPTTTTTKPISLPESERESDKLAHSKLLSKVFEEMDPKLKVIRRQLNDMVLDRQSSKTKKSSNRKKSPVEAMNTVFNPSTIGTGGKAGKTIFVVNVGRVENLYKTSKRDRGALHRPPQAKVDLHGCTQEEAVEKLGGSLKTWMKTAMHGSYPWVIPAVIVCGGGNQILSETVEGWIKHTESVANAPKCSASY